MTAVALLLITICPVIFTVLALRAPMDTSPFETELPDLWRDEV